MISESEFSNALAFHISRFTKLGEDADDKHLVDTLVKYVLGLLKSGAAPLSTTDGKAKLCLLLKEFFDDSTAGFVEWWVPLTNLRLRCVRRTPCDLLWVQACGLREGKRTAL